MDAKKKQFIAPIIVTVCVVIYFIFYFALILHSVEELWKWLFAIIPLALAGVIIKVCIERINEIKKGEEDDLSKY